MDLYPEHGQGCVCLIKVSTGIKGLDEMLGGGFPGGRVYLLTGGPGTGKTIFSLQFLSSALERGESGVYITLEEPLELIRENIEAFGWNLEEREKKNRLRLLDFCEISYVSDATESKNRFAKDPMNSLFSEIYNAVKGIDAKHLVLDPVTSVTIQESSVGRKRSKIAELFRELRRLGCTSILTSESVSQGEFYIEEFLADGVIKLEKKILDFNLINTVRIEKMRGIPYDEQPRKYHIDKRGLNVLNTESINI